MAPARKIEKPDDCHDSHCHGDGTRSFHDHKYFVDHEGDNQDVDRSNPCQMSKCKIHVHREPILNRIQYINESSDLRHIMDANDMRAMKYCAGDSRSSAPQPIDGFVPDTLRFNPAEKRLARCAY